MAQECRNQNHVNSNLTFGLLLVGLLVGGLVGWLLTIALAHNPDVIVSVREIKDGAPVFLAVAGVDCPPRSHKVPTTPENICRFDEELSADHRLVIFNEWLAKSAGLEESKSYKKGDTFRIWKVEVQTD